MTHIWPPRWISLRVINYRKSSPGDGRGAVQWHPGRPGGCPWRANRERGAAKLFSFPQSLFDWASVPGRTCGFGFVSCRGGDRNKDTTIAQHAVHHGCSTLEMNQFADSQLAVAVHCTDEDVFLKYVSVSKVKVLPASSLPVCAGCPPPRAS